MERNTFINSLNNAGLTSRAVSIQTLWINITKCCNQACTHCHVEASPNRNEQMSRSTIEQCLKVIGELESCKDLDITGGAPELHPDFEYIVSAASKMGKQVVIRHNLTVIADSDQLKDKEYLPYFFAENGVKVIASLPHYSEQLTDRIRGSGTFIKSINSLRKLNSLGYGQPDSGLIVDLVHNCDGPVSVKDRDRFEAEYKEILYKRYGIVFNTLLTVTNMPIGRFRSQLKDQGVLEQYIERLKHSFRPEAAADLVCRFLISVDHDGRLYDCDFNQMLKLGVNSSESASIYQFNPSALLHRKIRFGSHCFGCTAGGGSS